MATQTELQELKSFIGDRFNELDKKIDSVEKRLIKVEANTEGLDKRLSNVELATSKISEITEKFGELKNWQRISSIIIAAVISSIFSGTFGGVIGWLLRGGRI